MGKKAKNKPESENENSAPEEVEVSIVKETIEEIIVPVEEVIDENEPVTINYKPVNHEHFEPQPEPTGPPPRPEPVDESHTKPMAESTPKEKPEVKDPSHLKPQE